MKYIIGIDEAGRGPLAGPVAVGAVVVPADFDWELLAGVTDSKQLTEAIREEIFTEARRLKAAEQLEYSVAMVSAGVIDKTGITNAITTAMSRCLNRLEVNPHDVIIKLDGGLKAPPQYQRQETIIKGDQKERVIGLASIMAKVTRDRYMVRQSTRPAFTVYDFHFHKGYGTKAHRALIAKNGLSAIHRTTYCKNIKIR